MLAIIQSSILFRQLISIGGLQQWVVSRSRLVRPLEGTHSSKLFVWHHYMWELRALLYWVHTRAPVCQRLERGAPLIRRVRGAPRRDPGGLVPGGLTEGPLLPTPQQSSWGQRSSQFRVRFFRTEVSKMSFMKTQGSWESKLDPTCGAHYSNPKSTKSTWG